jgi:hypothetical protein
MIKSRKDLYAGVMFILFGAAFAVIAVIDQYPMGTSRTMGPAYFPTILGWILVVLGAIVAFRGFTQKEDDPTPISWNTLFWILGSAVVFGWLMDPLNMGFILAVFVNCVMCAFGGYEFKWKEAIIEGVVMVAVCWAAFVYGLGLPFRLFPWS